jgi:hypothetical protein
MKKRIILGSIVVLSLILLMPSIPAININAIDNKIHLEYEKLYLNSVIDIKIPDKFPLLYLLVVGVLNFQLKRVELLIEYAVDFENREIKHPLLILRAIMIIEIHDMWWNFWYYLSDDLGWGWFE